MKRPNLHIMMTPKLEAALIKLRDLEIELEAMPYISPALAGQRSRNTGLCASGETISAKSSPRYSALPSSGRRGGEVVNRRRRITRPMNSSTRRTGHEET
jgi:hypothetical protein